MKKFYFLSFLAISFLFFSCTDKVSYTLEANSHPSLKNKINYMDKKTEWTDSMDKALEDKKDYSRSDENRTSEKRPTKAFPSGVSTISSKDRLYYSKNHYKNAPLKPILEGFGDLDSSSISAETLSTIQTFVDGINSKELDMKCISANSQFLKPVFQYDFNSLDEVKSYIVGKPFIIKSDTLDEYQIPVRLLTENSYVDAIFFMTKENDKYLIEQIFYRGLISE